MLVIPGRYGKDTCDGFSRRELLRVGGSSLVGLSLPALLQSERASAAEKGQRYGGPGFGKAKRVILVYLQGGPSHLDLWDPKTDVPDNVRSVFKNIDTKLPGVQFTENLPKLAQVIDKTTLLRAVSWTVETAPPVIKSVHKPNKSSADPLHGRYETTVDGKRAIVEYEPDSDLRDSEQIPLLEPGGIEAFFRREVLPHTSDAWIDEGATKIGYEVSFTRHFYKPRPLRTLQEIEADIRALEQETEGLLEDVLTGGR